jgi:hypothetical protein
MHQRSEIKVSDASKALVDDSAATPDYLLSLIRSEYPQKSRYFEPVLFGASEATIFFEARIAS